MELTQAACPSTVPPPKAILIRNVTLPNGLLRRGAALSVGSPSQDLAFCFVPGTNNTYMYDSTETCDNKTTPIQCVVAHGSAFNEGKSTTWSTNRASYSSLIAEEDDQYPADGDLWGMDSLTLNSSLALNDFVLGILRNSFFELNPLGLGRNSTLLNALSSRNLITSRNWSIFWGWTGGNASDQMDGNLVLGGLDIAKTSAINSTSSLQFSQWCYTGLIVTISDITMDVADGSTPSILGASHGSALRMCVDPSYPIISIPGDVFQNFQNHTTNEGAFPGCSAGINLWGLVYDVPDVYTGNLTFTLASGLSITIPNHQLVVPDVQVNSDGSLAFNHSTQELLLNPLIDSNANDIPVLGQTFLTSAYLVVDYDMKEFTLWQANATLNEDIIALGPSTTCTGTSPRQTSTTAPVAPPPTSTTASVAASHFTPGTIAGSTIGGSVLILLLAIGWFFIRRRKIRKQQAFNVNTVHPSYTTNKMKLSDQLGSHSSGQNNGTHELPAFLGHEDGNLRPQEMPS